MANYYNRNSNARRRNQRETNNYPQTTLDFYISMYNNTSRQIDLLNENLNEIRHNIDYLVGISEEGLYSGDAQRSVHNPRVTVRERNNNYDYTNLNGRHMPQRTIPVINTTSNSSNNPLINQSNIINENISDIISLLNSYSSYSNVSIPNNTEIISNTTRLVTYSEIENPINDRCPISHELFQETDEVRQIIPCGHIFSNTEINRWLERNLHCPVCRYNLREHGTNNSSTTSTSDSSGNVVENNLLRYDIRYDISGNYLLFETYYR